MRTVNQAFHLYVEPGQLESTIAFIPHGPRTALGGRHLTVRNPDGLVVEYHEAAEAA